MKTILLTLFLWLSFDMGLAAQVPFQISLEPVVIDQLGGLQSYAVGTHNGQWLIVGGRLDGLHRRQPWASFDLAGHNNQLVVIDPETQDFWSASLAGLPANLQEQLSSTNMGFVESGDYLYLVGGYGYSAQAEDHTTFPLLTAVHVPGLIQVIVDGTELASHFRQLEDSRFAVTGGRLLRLEDIYYLVGGQRFEGRYNPMNHPSFTQEYTEEIRRFTITDNGTDLSVDFLPEWQDTDLLHRRDYNVCPQIFPDGTPGITIFSGVFQKDFDLPFLTAVDINPGGFELVDNFNQLYNHYHCPTLPVFQASESRMFTVFFGGMAQFYLSPDGLLIQDDEVPFVRTIAVVYRDADGTMEEIKLDVEMPGFLGAGAEFIPAPGLPLYDNGVLTFDELEEPILAGYIFGGIDSPDPNIFWINDGTQSSASATIYAVWLDPTVSTGLADEKPRAEITRLNAYPNPGNGQVYLEFNLSRAEYIRVLFLDETGRVLQEVDLPRSYFPAGQHLLELSVPDGSRIINLKAGATSRSIQVSGE